VAEAIRLSIAPKAIIMRNGDADIMVAAAVADKL